MAQAVTCGNCGQAVAIPEDATPEAVFPCPWCGHAVAVGSSAQADTVAEVSWPPQETSLIGLDANDTAPLAGELEAGLLVLTESPGPDQAQTATPGVDASTGSAVATAQQTPGLPGESAVSLASEAHLAAFESSALVSEPQPEVAVPTLAVETVAPASDDPSTEVVAVGLEVGAVPFSPNAESTAPLAAPADLASAASDLGSDTSDLGGTAPVLSSAPSALTSTPSDLGAAPADPTRTALDPASDDQIVQPPVESGLGVSTLPVAEEAIAPVAEELTADSAAGTDGASLAHALGDLWRAAGVAPPWDAPSEEHTSVAERRRADFPAPPFIDSSPAGGLHGFPSGPQRAVGSFAARARAQEKVSPRKLVRAVGMVISGLLAIGLTYGIFKLLGWGTRPGPPRPAASQKAKAGEFKPSRPGKEAFVPDWQGLKPPGGR